MLKTIQLPLGTTQQPIVKPLMRISDPWGWKTLNNDNNFQKKLW